VEIAEHNEGMDKMDGFQICISKLLLCDTK